MKERESSSRNNSVAKEIHTADHEDTETFHQVRSGKAA